MMTTETKIAEVDACKLVCIECQTTCINTLNYCKTKDDMDMTLMCMMRDCAKMCMMCVNMIMDGSEFVGRTCELCAEICIRVAMACEQIHDDTITKTAATFYNCAEKCQSVAKQSASYFRRPNFLTVVDITE